MTGGLACSPIQDVAFDALNVAAFATTLLGGRLYTDVPQGTAYPLAWLTFDDPSETEEHTFGAYGAVVHLEVHVFSAYEGDDEVADILSKAIELLHHQALTPTGWTVPLVTARPATIVVEEFNGTPLRHGIARFDVHARKS